MLAPPIGVIKDVIIRKWYAAAVNLPADRSERKDVGYEVNTCVPGELSPGEVETCIAIVQRGDAVNLRTMKRDLPRAGIIATARIRNQIIGVGAIKSVRRQYAAQVSANSGITFPAKTLELGYVAVDSEHRGCGLSHRITKILLSQHTGRLFATTDSEWMKKTLLEAGFSQKGKEWRGDRGILSFGERV